VRFTEPDLKMVSPLERERENIRAELARVNRQLAAVESAMRLEEINAHQEKLDADFEALMAEPWVQRLSSVRREAERVFDSIVITPLGPLASPASLPSVGSSNLLASFSVKAKLKCPVPGKVKMSSFK